MYGLWNNVGKLKLNHLASDIRTQVLHWKGGDFVDIKQSVINTFNRVGIDYKSLMDKTEKVEVRNRFSGEAVTTLPLIAYLVGWVYDTSNAYETGESKVNVSDFDRIRYFILEKDPDVYSTCID